jgi:hypothetical protein
VAALVAEIFREVQMVKFVEIFSTGKGQFGVQIVEPMNHGSVTEVIGAVQRYGTTVEGRRNGKLVTSGGMVINAARFIYAEVASERRGSLPSVSDVEFKFREAN